MEASGWRQAAGWQAAHRHRGGDVSRRRLEVPANAVLARAATAREVAAVSAVERRLLRWRRVLDSARIALTLDDAPSIRREEPVAFDADRMDVVRDTLLRNRIEHCTAFVVGESAAGREEHLRRWLASGYALGNHTFSHLRCSDTPRDEFVADVERCEALLAAVGARAAGAPGLFRFPFLDVPRDAEHRGAIVASLARLDLRVVHGCADLHDYRFEVPLARALARGDDATAAAALRRYVAAAVDALAFAIGGLRQRHGDFACIAYAHFGAVTARALPLLLHELTQCGVRWVPLLEAVADPIYQRFDAVPGSTGRVSDVLLPTSRWHALRRRMAALGASVGLLQDRRLGPRWPHLE